MLFHKDKVFGEHIYYLSQQASCFSIEIIVYAKKYILWLLK